jgi:hypothetical protein
MFDPGTGNCKAKKGLLVLRECGQPAIGACGKCGIPVCQQHQIIISQTGMVYCPECAAQDAQMAPTGHVGRARRRTRYYTHYGYYGGHWHTHDYFTERDHAAVQHPAGKAAGVSAGATADAAGGVDADHDDLDDMDALES